MSENAILAKYRRMRDSGCAGSLCDAFRDCYDEIAAIEASLLQANAKLETIIERLNSVATSGYLNNNMGYSVRVVQAVVAILEEQADHQVLVATQEEQRE